MSTLKTWSSLIKDIYFQKLMLNLAHWENEHMAFAQLACLERFPGLSQEWGKHMTCHNLGLSISKVYLYKTSKSE